jgi:hypothetical protein
MIWGSADHHKREMRPATDKRRRCGSCPKGSRVPETHVGFANGVALMGGCEWHVRQWVRDPDSLRRKAAK